MIDYEKNEKGVPGMAMTPTESPDSALELRIAEVGIELEAKVESFERRRMFLPLSATAAVISVAILGAIDLNSYTLVEALTLIGFTTAAGLGPLGANLALIQRAKVRADASDRQLNTLSTVREITA